MDSLKKFFLLLFIGIMGKESLAAPVPDGSQEIKPWLFSAMDGEKSTNPERVQHWRQPDGTETFLVEDHRAPVVIIRIRFPGGSYSPWAHRLQANLAFQMQTHDTTGKLSQHLREGGLYFYTVERSFENELVVHCLRSSLPQALRFLQSIWQNIDWNESSLAKKRVSQSWLWKNQQQEPSFRMEQMMRQAFYSMGDSRRISWEAPVLPPSSMSPLVEVRNTQLGFPGRCVGWAGDIDKPTVIQAMTSLLPAIRSEIPSDVYPVYKPLQVPQRDQTGVVDKTQQAYIAYARAGLGVEDARFPILLLAHHIWGGHFYSRLYKALRGEQGTTYEVNASLISTREPDLYYVTTYTSMAKLTEIETKLQSALQRFFAEGVLPLELVDAQSYFLHHTVFEEQTPNQILETALSERARGLPIGFTKNLHKRIQELTLEEVNQFVREFFNPSAFRIFRVLSR